MTKKRKKEIREAALQVSGGLSAITMPSKDGERIKSLVSGLVGLILELTEQ